MICSNFYLYLTLTFLSTLILAAPINFEIPFTKKGNLPSPIEVYLPSNRADIWDFSSEFSNLCSHLYPVDDDHEPRFISSEVKRTLVNDDYHRDEAEASCIYQYPSGDYLQLALFIAEELNSEPLTPSHSHQLREKVAMMEKKRDLSEIGRLKLGKRV